MLNKIDAMRALMWHGETVHVIRITHGTDMSDDGYWSQDDVSKYLDQCQPKIVMNEMAHCIRAGYHMFATDEQKLAKLLKRPEPKHGEPRKVRIAILRDNTDPDVLAVSINGVRVTNRRDTGGWDVIALWPVDAGLVVTACAEEDGC